MPAAATPTVLIAFAAGLLSFLSPCVLPLFPSYLSYISGVSVSDLGQGGQARRTTVKHSLAFVGGFSVIWVALGLTSSLLGQFFIDQQDRIRVVGGLFAMFMGLLLTGWIRIPFLMQEKRFQISNRPSGYLGSAALGLAFAAGWTPCIGPALAAVLALTATNPAAGALPLLAYSLGFAIPFLAGAWGLSSFRGLVRHSETVARVGGVLMILMGFLLATNQMTRILAFFTDLFGYQSLL